MTGPVALALDGVRVRYGPTVAVDGVSLHVRHGEVVGLLGPNGSGKSTTLAAAAGVLDPFEGTVAVEGIHRDADPTGYASRVGLVPQEPALYDDLSAEANLNFFGKLYGLNKHDRRVRVDAALTRAKLTDRRRDRVSTFSGGMRQRLNLACALLHAPAVLLLDEPTAALDPASRDGLFATLHELRDAGHAVLLTTHHLDEAEHSCDRIAVLDRGRVVACGRPTELLRATPAGRAVLYGHLRERLPRSFVKGLGQRVGAGVELEVTGRRLRLAAATQEMLGRALAVVLADGVVLETFRTPPGRLEHLLRGPAEQKPPLALAPMPFPPPGIDEG
ncbi:MAG TPA: ABC transporter ATP-binding protein [Fimbriiglobus sp.]|nr:ABC transporter ATP-binding protein [Fimbriiglobus sp.]